jgi:hypothetical protein
MDPQHWFFVGFNLVQRHGSPPDPDSCQNVTDPQHWLFVRFNLVQRHGSPDPDSYQNLQHTGFLRAGRGAYGVVEKMKHKQTGTILAVKRITATVNSVEQRRLLMDLDISMRSSGMFVCVEQGFGSGSRKAKITYPQK